MAKVYVQDNGDGTYSTVYESNGAYEVIYTGDQSTAENNANVVRETRLGQPPTPAPRTSPTPRSGGGGGAGTSGDISDILRAIAESNDIDLAEKIRQFNETLAWAKEQFGWSKEEFKLQYDLARRQFNEGLRQFNMNYGLKAAELEAGLAGTPLKPLSYAQTKQNIDDIYSFAQGGQAAQAFGAPAQREEVMRLVDLLGGRGYGGGDVIPPIMWPGDETAELSTEAAYDWIWSKRTDLKGFFEGAGWDVSTPEKQRLAVKEWIEKTDPQWRGKTAQQVAAELGYKPPATTPGPTNPPQTGDFPIETAYTQQRGTIPPGGRSMPSPMDYLGGGGYPVSAKPQSFKDTLIKRGTIGTKPAPVRPPVVGPQLTPYGGRDPIPSPEPPPSENPDNPPPGMDPGIWAALGPTARNLYRQQGYLVNNPHQINPAMWDSLSPSGQGAIINAAELGYSPSGMWRAEDYIRGINAARPKGTAPRRVSMNYSQPHSLF